MKIYYHSKLKKFSRKLRNSGTLGEALLWNVLKGKKLMGYLFTRQKPIDRYIVDFFCNKLKLVIEIDGYSHEGKFLEDQIRQKKLESLGLTVLRFSEKEVREDINNVLEVIESWIRGFKLNGGEQPPDPLC